MSTAGDALIVAAAMSNFDVLWNLKAYIDYVMRPSMITEGALVP